MEHGLKNNLTYLKSKDDYVFSFNKLSEISRSYLGDIPDYDKIEETFIICLIPQIFYLGIDKLLVDSADGIYKLFIKIKRENLIDFNEEKLKQNTFETILLKTKEVSNKFTYLKYYNTSGDEIRNRDNFYKNSKLFLELCGIWPREGEEDWNDCQYEWDIEYHYILSIVYHCNSLEEVNEVYKTFWLHWTSNWTDTWQFFSDYLRVLRLDPNGIYQEAKMIWDHLDQWKEMMGN
jgi:hypothetical protein